MLVIGPVCILDFLPALVQLSAEHSEGYDTLLSEMMAHWGYWDRENVFLHKAYYILKEGMLCLEKTLWVSFYASPLHS